MSSLFSHDDFDFALRTTKELLLRCALPIPLWQELREIEKVYLTFLQSTTTTDLRVVHFGKVLRLIPFRIASEEDKVNLVQYISISQAIHHEALISPVGWVKGDNYPDEVLLAYNLDNPISWNDYSSNANLSWAQRAATIKSLASALQLCTVYGAYIRGLSSDILFVENMKDVRLIGLITIGPQNEDEINTNILFSFGSLALTCISWGKISSSIKDISLFDPDYLLLQQQFIPLDCPEVLEALAYACCDIHAPQLPSISFVAQQLSSMIPDIKDWEAKLEAQQQAALQSDSMGAARTAKRFSLLFNADDFHQHLLKLPPSEDFDTQSTFSIGESVLDVASPSPASKKGLDIQQRRLSHRSLRPSMYVPRTTTSSSLSATHQEDSDVPMPLLRLNGQLLDMEYELAQAVQELENPFARMEWEQHHPEAFYRVLQSVQHCIKRIESHISILNSAATGKDSINKSDEEDDEEQYAEPVVTNHVPHFGNNSAEKAQSTFISPPESGTSSMPLGTSVTSKLFAAWSEEEAGDQEVSEEVPTQRKGNWSPRTESELPTEVSPFSEDGNQSLEQKTEGLIASDDVISQPDSIVVSDDQVKATKPRIYAFTSSVSEREIMHPRPIHAVAAEASVTAGVWSSVLNNPISSHGLLQVGDEGAHEIQGIVIHPTTTVSQRSSAMEAQLQEKRPSSLVSVNNTIELQPSDISSQKTSRSTSPRAITAGAPPPPPPPPRSSQAPSPAISVSSSRRPSGTSAASAQLSTATATHSIIPPPPPPPPTSRRPSQMSIVSEETPSAVVVSNRADSTIPVAESAISSILFAHIPKRPSLSVSQSKVEIEEEENVDHLSHITEKTPMSNLNEREDRVRKDEITNTPIQDAVEISSAASPSVKSSPSFHNFTQHPPLLAVAATNQSQTNKFSPTRSASPSLTSVGSSSYMNVNKSSGMHLQQPNTATKTVSQQVSSTSPVPSHAHVTMGSLNSPLASASHFLDKIRHLDEMFSNMAGDVSAHEEEKRLSPLPAISSPVNRVSPYNASRQPVSSSRSPSLLHESYRNYPMEDEVDNRYNNNDNDDFEDEEGYTSLPHQYQPSSSHHNYPSLSPKHSVSGYPAHHHLSPPPQPGVSQSDKSKQMQQTLQMYLSLVQRCSNTSARAKQVLDHLDHQMTHVSATNPPISPSSAQRVSAHQNRYGHIPPSTWPTQPILSKSRSADVPSYMQPTKSSVYGTSSTSDSRRHNADFDMSPTTLSRSNSYSSSRGPSSSNYLGTMSIPNESSIHAQLTNTASLNTSGYSSQTGSRSNSAQRGRKSPSIRSPIAKEVLSTRQNPRVYSISPGKRR